jgi:signal transduction histidine kinase/CheY-like chemotaxis protein
MQITDDNRKLVGVLEIISRLSGKLIALMGGVVLVGWLVNSEIIKRGAPGLVAMNPLTAVCFIIGAFSLVCLWSARTAPSAFKIGLGQALAGVLIAVGLLKLIQYVIGWSFSLDAVLFARQLATEAGAPNRMAPNTAFNFLLCGLALLRLNSAGRSYSRLAQGSSLVVACVSLLALLGYAYGAHYLYGIGPHLPMALNTAGLFLLLSVACLFAQTDSPTIALFASQTPGGVTARRLLPVAIGLPALLGAVRLWGEKLRLYDSEFGTTLMVVVAMAVLTVLIWWNAVLLNRADTQRRAAEEALKKAHDDLELRVQERAAEVLKLQEQFLRSQRMESIGALAGGIAHDLNNALAPILMAGQLMEEAQATELDRKRFLELIMASAHRCSQMVKQILTFARGSRGQSGSVPLRHLVTDITKLTRDTFPKSITIQARLPAGLWDVKADPTELYQVLMNLCVNARDAMPRGGQLTLSAQNMDLQAEALPPVAKAKPGAHLLISVKDTGIGMPPNVLTRIFEPFFTTKAPDKGTGLGLSTVATILDKHNGFVEVHSEVGRGTEFRLYFPAAVTGQPAEPTATEAALPLGHGELILVVDDEQSVLELARTALESYGYRVLTAANGLEAVHAFETHRADIRLVITDTDMPFADGIETIRVIQGMKSDIPMIVASGSSRDTEFLHRLGRDHVLTLSKPYGVQQLLVAVAEALPVAK